MKSTVLFALGLAASVTAQSQSSISLTAIYPSEQPTDTVITVTMGSSKSSAILPSTLLPPRHQYIIQIKSMLTTPSQQPTQSPSGIRQPNLALAPRAPRSPPTGPNNLPPLLPQNHTRNQQPFQRLYRPCHRARLRPNPPQQLRLRASHRARRRRNRRRQLRMRCARISWERLRAVWSLDGRSYKERLGGWRWWRCRKHAVYSGFGIGI